MPREPAFAFTFMVHGLSRGACPVRSCLHVIQCEACLEHGRMPHEVALAYAPRGRARICLNVKHGLSRGACPARSRSHLLHALGKLEAHALGAFACCIWIGLRRCVCRVSVCASVNFAGLRNACLLILLLFVCIVMAAAAVGSGLSRLVDVVGACLWSIFLWS